MIKSMTGFSSSTKENNAAIVNVTVRSVNHRYLDIQIRGNQIAQEQEREIREIIQSGFSRGRIELNVHFEYKDELPFRVELNKTLVQRLLDVAGETAKEQSVAGKWTIGELLRFPKVVKVTEEPRDEAVREEGATLLIDVVVEALREMAEMRTKEGEYLAKDLNERLDILKRLMTQIETAAEEGQDSLRKKLLTRIEQMSTDVVVEPALISQEVVRYAARSDIHEEIARLKGHVKHWEDLSNGEASCGRKFDFLVQEMNREVNTIGSKSDGTSLPALIVEAKSELERLREQVQNVE